MNKSEQEFCERCPANSSCGYVLRKLKNKCVPLNIFAKGYEQAERNLALTWKDIRRISEIGEAFMNEDNVVDVTEQQYYDEILRRFNEERSGEA